MNDKPRIPDPGCRAPGTKTKFRYTATGAFIAGWLW